MARCGEGWAIWSATSAKAHPFFQLQLQDCWGPSHRSRWIRWNTFLSIGIYTPSFVLACTVLLFNSQGTKRGSGAKGTVSLRVHQQETLRRGLDLLLPMEWHCYWRQMDLLKVFSDVIWIPGVPGAQTVTVALLEGSTWVLITRC